MFKKFLNATKVGGHPNHPDKQQLQVGQANSTGQQYYQNQLLGQLGQAQANLLAGYSNQQQQQLQLKNQFQLNEIKSYGFSQLSCLGHSASLSLLAVGSKTGLVRVLGGPSIEFSYQLDASSAIRQLEFIDNRPVAPVPSGKQPGGKQSQQQQQAVEAEKPGSGSVARLLALTDSGQLHLFELSKVCELNFADGTTQTTNASDQLAAYKNESNASGKPNSTRPDYTQLEHVGRVDYFKCKPDQPADRSKRVSTLEVSSDGRQLFVGTEGANVYLLSIDDFLESAKKANNAHDKQPEGLDDVVTREQQQVQSPQTKTTTLAQKSDQDLQDQVATDADCAITADILLSPEQQTLVKQPNEPFEMIKFEEQVLSSLLALQPEPTDQVKSKKPGAIESIKRHPKRATLLLISYHRGLNVLWDLVGHKVESYYYHDQILESSCFADEQGDFFYTSHNDGSYVRWDSRHASQAVAPEDNLNQVYGPYPCKPTPKLLSCVGLRIPSSQSSASSPASDHSTGGAGGGATKTASADSKLDELIVFTGGMPRATYDDKNPVTIVRREPDGKDTIKMVLDFTSKVLDFAIITQPRSAISHPAAELSAPSGGGGGAGGGGGKKTKLRQQQLLQQQRNQQVAIALAVLAEEEFVVIDLLSEDYHEFPLPYLNCVHSSAITCNEHYSNISEQLFGQLVALNKQQLKANKLTHREWPITGGKIVDSSDFQASARNILLTGHEDGTANVWDVSGLSTRHLLCLSTSKYFSTSSLDDSIDQQQQQQQDEQSWPPMKRVGRFDPYSDDTRLAVRKLALCPQLGSLVVAGTGGQVLVFELRKQHDAPPAERLAPSEVTIVADQRFVWKGHEKLSPRISPISQQQQQQAAPDGDEQQAKSYHLVSYVQLNPPVSPTAIALRSDWHLYAIGTSYGFLLYDYVSQHSIVSRCTLNVQDFSLIGGDAPGTGAMSRKKSFRKSLRESFRRLRRGRSQRYVAAPTSAPPATTGVVTPAPKSAFSRPTTGVRSLNPAGSSSATGAASQQQAISSSHHHQPHQADHSGVRFAAERQVEVKVELSSIIKCISLTSAVISGQQAAASFKPTLWVGTNSGQVLVYAISLASEQQQQQQYQHHQQVEQSSSDASTSGGAAATASSGSGGPQTSARLAKEIQLKHRAPIVAIFTSPEAPEQQLIEASGAGSSVVGQHQLDQSDSKGELSLLQKSSSSDSEGLRSKASEAPSSPAGDSAAPDRPSTPSVHLGHLKLANNTGAGAKLEQQQQPRVLICSEEQFKVFNLPNLKPFCKFKLTANEGLRARKVSITQFKRQLLAPAVVSSGGRSSKGLKASKSVQSFATQTSRPSSPADEPEAGGGKQAAPAEHNNNSPSALNNNNNNNTGSSTNQLMNAKFGANTKTSSSVATSAQAANMASSASSNQIQAAQLAEHFDAETAAAAAIGAPGSQVVFEPYLVCMSNAGDCAIYSVPELKRQAQIQVCKREDVNGISSTMLTEHGEGYYLKSSSQFLRFSISNQQVPRVYALLT